MQLYVLVIIMGVLVSQGANVAAGPALPDAAMAAAALGPYVLLGAVAWLVCVLARRAMARRPGRAIVYVNRVHLLLTVLRWASVGVLYSALFALGLLDWLASGLGGVILAGELIALACPLGLVIFMWWAYYPIDRRLREALLIRQIDEGEPVFGIHDRGAYVLDQLRHQVLIVLVPLLMIMVWVEVVAWVARRWSDLRAFEPILVAAGGLSIFAVAPLVIRLLWHTSPMPAGPLRDRLVHLCRTHGVRVRELLLWHTHGGQINGAVMGVFGPLRYILLTDGLVERMDDREVEAVMAHELGHVRRHHMPWMAICAIGLLGAMFLGVERGAAMVDQHLGWEGVHAAVLSVGLSGPSAPTRAAAGGVLLLAFVLWGAAFGYISRRFERQADTFAVQHLATQHLDDECGQTNDRDVPRIDARAVADMAGALETVCRLNRSSTARPSWRHGSVDWRVGYLHSLVGRRIDDCPIDRHIRRLRLTGAALLLATVATELLG